MKNEGHKRILLIYPKMGMSGILVHYMPLSLLYAAVESIKAGFEIDIVDMRLHLMDWRKSIVSKISKDTILVGVSVMTGAPIRNALEITNWIREQYPNIKIVWGGPHATFNGAEILKEPNIDFVIRGYGSFALSLLAKHICNEGKQPNLHSINGLVFRDNNTIVDVPCEDRFEVADYRDIPYSLIKDNLGFYGQLDSNDRIFPLYSALGCPYGCAFCSSPAQYRNIKKKYVPIPASEVVDHIEYVHREYKANYIYFIDDDSFVELGHVEEIIDEINRRGLAVRLGFRGARINEIQKMSDEYLNKLAVAGTNIFHIGAESGSQRILDLIRKDCTVESIMEVNRKMARHPEIIAAYNWVVGFPGETVEDLQKTRKLISSLIKDNPSAIIFIPNKYRPLPGTELYDTSMRYGYIKPRKLEDWIEVEAEGDYRPPWYTKDLVAMIHMMQIASFFIDKKIRKVNIGNTFKFKILRFVARLYSPIARFRFSSGISSMLLEYKLFYWFTSMFRA